MGAVRSYWSVWGDASSAVRAVHIATGCSVKWDRRSQSPSGSGCLGTVVLAFGHETVCFVFLGPGALVLSLRVFFVKNLLSSW